MTAVDTIQIALTAIWANRLRSALTLLGVIIGVTSVITIISAIEALMGGVREQVEVIGPTTFFVNKFGMMTDFDDYLDALKKKDLTTDDMEAVRESCPLCKEVGGVIENNVRVSRQGRGLRNVYIAGTTTNYLDMVDLELAEGRYFQQYEYDHRNHVAFVGPTVVEELIPGGDPIGSIIKVGGHKFKIIGVAKKRGAFLGGDNDNFVCIPLTTYHKLFGRTRSAFSLVAMAASIESLPEAQDQVRAVLRARRGIDYYEREDFYFLTAENILQFFETITRAIRIALIGISSIAIVVGGIVIMNIMMVSVTERTREIGIRKSIGARRKSILMQFLYEALILSVGGGVIGTTLGILVAAILAAKISLHLSPSIFAIASGLSISTGVGVFFGMYPAIKASRLDPVEALRYEK